MQYLASGDSLPLGRRLDGFTLQIKIIKDKEVQRPMPEEIAIKSSNIKDMRSSELNFGAWSAAI